MSTTPPTACTICRHAEHESINSALGAGESLRSLAETYGVSRAALSRHGQHHLTAKAPLALQEVSATTPRRFSSLGQVGARLEELTAIVGQVGKFGAQKADARMVLQAARVEIETLIKISERLPQSSEGIFAEGRDRALQAVSVALRSSAADPAQLSALFDAVDRELIAQGVDEPTAVGA